MLRDHAVFYVAGGCANFFFYVNVEIKRSKGICAD